MEPRKPRKRGPVKQFDRQLSLYENAEGIDLLVQIAERRGLSQSSVIRDLIRKEAERLGVQPG